MTMLMPTPPSCSGREQLALAELGHVREDRHVHGPAHRLELGEVGHRLGEDRVRAGIHQLLRAVDRRLQPVDGPDVGARHDEEVRVAPGIHGRTDALDRRVLVDDLLAVEVAAALGVDLVLDVQAGDAGVLEGLHGAGDVHRLAEAGVGVDERGQVGHPGDLLGAPGDLGQGGQADVRQAQVGREHGAGDVDALEALVLDEARRSAG